MNKTNYDKSLYNAIKGNLTKPDVNVEKITSEAEANAELKSLQEVVKMLGIKTQATTVDGLKKAIADHNNKPNEANVE